MKLKVFDHETLLRLNESSIRAGRNQNLGPNKLPPEPRERYWINHHETRERDGRQEVRMCVVLRLYGGETAWLDVSNEEFEAIPEVDLSVSEWEVALCAGFPPAVP